MQTVFGKLNGVLIALALATASAGADEIAEKGLAVFNRNSQAVVTLEIVLKTSFSSNGRSSGPREAKEELTGTVIDPSGLTVLALSACDPGEFYRRMSPDYKVETEINDLKILQDDGTEMPCEIVLRDKDLDLAFVRPKAKPAKPMPAIDLTKSAPAGLLDQVITLNRLNRAAGRAHSASIERINAVIAKPRTIYIPDGTMSTTTLGSPAFSLNGNIIGLFVIRSVSSAGERSSDNFTSIIVPA
jgi:S1-C subfamily serine protease